MTERSSYADPPAVSQRVEAALAMSAEILDQVQDTLAGGRIKGIRISFGKHTIREIPVRTAALSAILIAAAAVIVTQLRIEVDKG